VKEFEIIDGIIATLGPVASGAWVSVGPGDDAAITRVPAGHELASSVDSLLGDVHFPAEAPADLIGYRAMMVSLSDLAAVGAKPAWALVSLSAPNAVESWVDAFAQGLAHAANDAEVAIVGGNVAAGPLQVTVSVHGFVPSGRALLRSGARPGDAICLSGPVGGAASALRRLDLSACNRETLNGAARAYWMPQPPFELAVSLRDSASSCIDVSDGLLQDLAHVCRASQVGADLKSASIPLAEDAELSDGLSGGDDYVLCFTTGEKGVAKAHSIIGEVIAGEHVRLDGELADTSGYQHF
jgi:thiamine-monophosphate kinase